MFIADSLNAGRHPHLKQAILDRTLHLEAPPPGDPRAVMASRALYDSVVARVDDILVRHPGLAAGVHVSLLRLIDWPAA